MMKWILISAVSSCIFSTALAQQDTLVGNGAITVFTATKTERSLSNIAVPVQKPFNKQGLCAYRIFYRSKQDYS